MANYKKEKKEYMEGYTPQPKRVYVNRGNPITPEGYSRVFEMLEWLYTYDGAAPSRNEWRQTLVRWIMYVSGISDIKPEAKNV